ncbi:MAG: GNAT family N-acetyltransferase [Erysipelotrichaceae bacterium]|nr:GNAT family N-acetyltransferase [Erysipelotrichaceae bacterium]
MKIRLANESDRKQVYETIGYCFNTPQDSIENNIKNGTLNQYEQFIVAEENNQIYSLVSVVPFKMNFEGKVVDFGGIAGVSSLPECRGKGNISDIFSFALNYMKEKNMIFSGLGPFSFPFYRQFGYEWCYTWQLVEVNVNDLKAFKSAFTYKKLTKEDSDLTEKFRNKVNKKLNGPFVRSAKQIEDKWNEYKSKNAHVYGAFNENNELVSYMVYTIEGRMLKAFEIYFVDEESKEYLLSFIYKHRSSIDSAELILDVDDTIRNVLPSPRIKYWHWPNKMGRIVMVKEALKMLNVLDDTLNAYTIKVNDKQAPWNDKTFKINVNNHQVEVSETSDNADLEIDINRLSQITLGHISAKEALQSNFVKVNNHKALDAFIKTFSKRTTMLWQEF